MSHRASSHKFIRTKKQCFWIIVTLGFLSAMNPFSTDMYLPAFQQIALALQTTTASLSLTLSSYFIGIAVGQLGYGPLLDRFGRKKPLYGGLALYIVASVGCIFSHHLQQLVAWRFLTAVGGCVATVASVAIVRDLFTVKESFKIFALLMLVLGVSPLLAPTIGSIVSVNIGWQGVFIILMIIAFLMILGTALVIPESHPADPSVLLTPGPILSDYYEVLLQPQFHIYAFTNGASLAALFTFIAASPVIFFTFFKVSVYNYGCIFTMLAAGFIGGSQLNILLLRRFYSLQILRASIFFQCLISLLFLLGAWGNWLNLPLVLVLLFGMLLCIGCASPNAAGLAMAPFAKKAGRASALLSSSQMVLGSISSVTIGMLDINSMRPIAWIFLIAPLLAALFLFLGRKTAVVLGEEESGEGAIVLH